MDKKKVSVFVAGQKFNLITDEEERYVIDLAAKIDARISSLSISQCMSRERAAVLTALDMADDIEQGKRNLNEVKEQVKDYLKTIEALTAENTELHTQLSKEQLDGEALADAQRMLAESDKEKEALKRQIIALKEQITVMQQAGYQTPHPEEESPAPQEAPAPAEEIPVEEAPAPVEEVTAEEETPAEAAAAVEEDTPAAPAVTAEDDLFFGMS